MGFVYDINSDGKQSSAFRNLMVTHTLNSIVSLFVTTFLVAHIYTFSSDLYNYLFNVSIFSIAYYFGYAVLYLLFSIIVEKTNRVIIYKIAIIAKTVLVIFLIFFGKDLAKLLVVAGIMIAIADGLYYSSYSVIRQEMVSRTQSSSFSAVFFILAKIVEVVCPILLGALIDVISFSYTAIIVLLVCVIQLCFASRIKSHKPDGSSFGLFAYLKLLHSKKDIAKRLKILYFISAIYGVTYLSATLLNICIMIEYSSSFSLGLITGIISAGTILVILFMSKFTKQGNRSWLFIVSSILPTVCAIIFAFNFNQITLILLNTVLLLSTIVHTVIYDAHRNGTLKEIGLYDQIAEHQSIIEFGSGMSRTVFYAITILVASFNNFMLFKLYILVVIALCMTVHLGLLIYEKKYLRNNCK